MHQNASKSPSDVLGDETIQNCVKCPQNSRRQEGGHNLGLGHGHNSKGQEPGVCRRSSRARAGSPGPLRQEAPHIPGLILTLAHTLGSPVSSRLGWAAGPGRRLLNAGWDLQGRPHTDILVRGWVGLGEHCWHPRPLGQHPQ